MEDELGIKAYRSRGKKRKIYHKNHPEWKETHCAHPVPDAQETVLLWRQ